MSFGDEESHLGHIYSEDTYNENSAVVQSTSPSNSIISTYDTLYSSLSYNLKEADLTIEEKDFLIERTNDSNMPRDKKEIIYALCLIDYFRYFPNTKVIYPYKCKQVQDDVLEIKLDSLPIRLKQILYKFVRF